MLYKKKIILVLTFLIISIIISLLIYKQVVYPTIIPMTVNTGISIFADWTVILNANMCEEKGFDVFVSNPCDHWDRKHIYGKILLYLPYIKIFPKFYFLYFPLFVNLFFVWVIVNNLFTLQNKKNFFLLLVFIFNVPLLLAIERANIDIIVYIIAFLIAKNRNIFVNYFLITLATLGKFYPICLSIIFFFRTKLKDIFVNLLIIFSLILIIFIFQIDSFKKIFDNLQQFSGYGSGVYEFSFSGGVRFINFLIINLDGSNYSWIKYIILFLFILLPIALINNFYSKKIRYHGEIANLFFENTFENRFYIISSVLIISCYFAFSNFIYREIFFIGLLPWILKKEKTLKNNNFLTSYFYILFFKFLLSTPIIFLSKNNIFPNFDPIFIIIKHSLDFFLMTIVIHVFLFSLFSFYKKKFKNIIN